MSGYADIRPGGLNQRELVDLLYMMVASLKTLCAKLDNDATVTLETYTANCYTAIIKTKIYDSRGNETGDNGAEEHIISPAGLSATALNEVLYQIVNAFETLCEQIDKDNITDTDYEDLCYEAIISPYQFEDKKGNIIGQDNTLGTFLGGTPYHLYKFGPSGVPDDRHLIDFLYDYMNAWETLCEKLDADAVTAAPPTDQDYEELCYEAIFVLMVENSEGNMLGNTQIRLG